MTDLDKEIMARIKPYVAYVLDHDQRIKNIDMKVQDLEKITGKEKAIAILARLDVNLEYQINCVEVVRKGIADMRRARTLEELDACEENIKEAQKMNDGYQAEFKKISRELRYVMMEEPSLKDRFIADPMAALRSMEAHYPEMARLTDLQLQYLAKSEFVSRELAPLLRNSPWRFADRAYGIASRTEAVTSKHGVFVEVLFGEQGRNKPGLMSALMSPKAADKYIKQLEAQIRRQRMLAEKQGDCVPFVRCTLAIFYANEGQITSAFKTSLDIGDGEQESIIDHLKQISSARDITAAFEASLRERGSGEMIPFYDTQHGETNRDEISPISDRRMTVQGWSDAVMNAKNPENGKVNPNDTSCQDMRHRGKKNYAKDKG